MEWPWFKKKKKKKRKGNTLWPKQENTVSAFSIHQIFTQANKGS